MSDLERRLDRGRFLRTCRRQVANLGFVREVKPRTHGDYVLVLADGHSLPLGRRYRRRFLELIG
jgi:two-component system LytT family response regulator